MHIIFDDAVAKEMSGKYIVLDLDQFQLQEDGQVFNSYCVVEMNAALAEEISTVENMVKLHNEMMKNYRNQKWEFCEYALDQLFGRWGREVDSFYISLTDRVRKYKERPPEDFNKGVIKKYTANQ